MCSTLLSQQLDVNINIASITLGSLGTSGMALMHSGQRPSHWGPFQADTAAQGWGSNMSDESARHDDSQLGECSK